MSSLDRVADTLSAALQDISSLKVEMARMRQRLVEIRRERDHAWRALGFYADPEGWMLRRDPKGGYMGSVMSEDRGALARSTLREGWDEESKPSEAATLRKVPTQWEALSPVPAHNAAQQGAQEEPMPQEQVQCPEV